MPLVVVGINHLSAPIEIREQVAFAPEQLFAAHTALFQLNAVQAAVIVSTCNRSELYCDLTNLDATARLLSWLAEFHHLNSDQLVHCSYQKVEGEAMRHLSRVASGLDSQVIGEPQIFGQLKSAYAVAQSAQTLSGSLNLLFQHSFSVAKAVRTDTAIGRNPISIAYAAVDLSSRLFANLTQCQVLLIGAGETIELVAKHLRERGISRITVANRTLERAKRLADAFGAKAILLGDIPEVLAQCDIVISSTASQLPILGKGTVERALKKRRHAPMFFVDIAVPRDIEVEVNELPDAYLYSVDDLQSVVADNMASRQNAAAEADALIEQAVQQFQMKQKERQAGRHIRALRAHVETLASRELQLAERRLKKGDDPQEVLTRLTHGLTRKFLHAPLRSMREASQQGVNTEIEPIYRWFDFSAKTKSVKNDNEG